MDLEYVKKFVVKFWLEELLMLIILWFLIFVGEGVEGEVEGENVEGEEGEDEVEEIVEEGFYDIGVEIEVEFEVSEGIEDVEEDDLDDMEEVEVEEIFEFDMIMELVVEVCLGSFYFV